MNQTVHTLKFELVINFGIHLVVKQLRGVGICQPNFLRDLREGPAEAVWDTPCKPSFCISSHCAGNQKIITNATRLRRANSRLSEAYGQHIAHLPLCRLALSKLLTSCSFPAVDTGLSWNDESDPSRRMTSSQAQISQCNQ